MRNIRIIFGYGQPGLFSLRGILAFVFLAALAEAAWTDFHTRVIPNRLVLEILGLGALDLWFFRDPGIADRLLGFFAAAGPLLLLNLAVPGVLGGGDIKLLAAGGWFLGVKGIFCAASAGFLAAGGWGAFQLLTRRLGRKDPFPLGPFLAFGLALAVFFGDALAAWYLGT